MARMFPERLPDKRFDGEGVSRAEEKLYNNLRDGLGDDYTVLWSIAFQTRLPGKGVEDGEIDFLILHPEKGFIVIEVKGGEVYHNAQTGEWYSVDRNGVAHRIKDPFKQVQKNYHAFRGWLGQIGTCRGGTTGYIVAFPDCLFSYRFQVNFPKEIVWDYDTLKDIKGAVEQAIDHYSRNESSPGKHCINDVVRALAPTWKLRSPLMEEALEAQEEFTEQQYTLLDTLQRQRRAKITGCAGSGKTFLAAEKARRLAKSGFDVLFLCFNKNLATRLKESLEPFSVHVDTFHGFCVKYIEKAGISLPDYNPGGEKFWREVLPEILTKAIEIRRKGIDNEEKEGYPFALYDALIVDEGQDFEDLWWIPLEQILRDPQNGIFYIFYDDNQAIFTSKFHFPIDGEPYILTKNCRNTKPIHDLFIKYYKGDHSVECEYKDKGAPKPEFIEPGRDEIRSLRRLLHRIVNEEGIEPKDIVILTPHKMMRSVIRTGMRVGNFELVWNPPIGKDLNPNQIPVFTIHSFKGLESPVVVVIEVNDIKGWKNRDELLYVAFSRARVRLFVIGIRERSRK